MKTGQQRLRLGLHAPPLPPPPVRGRLLYVEDVQERLGRFPEGHARAGQFRKSRYFVTHCVAPSKKLRIGRDVAWWTADVDAWLDEQQEQRA